MNNRDRAKRIVDSMTDDQVNAFIALFPIEKTVADMKSVIEDPALDSLVDVDDLDFGFLEGFDFEDCSITPAR